MGQTTKRLISYSKLKSGSKIILYPVKNPEIYGVADLIQKIKLLRFKKKLKTKIKFSNNRIIFF